MTAKTEDGSTRGESDTDFLLIATTLDEGGIYDRSDRNVGIGTASPTEKLEVNGNIKCRKLKVTVCDTDSLPAAGGASDGTIVVEDGPGGRCLIYYSGGQRFRVQGSSF